MAFEKATRTKAKLRIALAGPSGSGKTFTMLVILALLGKKRAVMDSEHGSASLYAVNPGEKPSTPADILAGRGRFEFDVENMENKTIQEFREKIAEARAADYDALGIDSFSHSWTAALEAVDRMGGWVKAGKHVSPIVAGLVQDILSYPGHVVCTMRAKTEHVIEKDEKTGKTAMRKVGLAPVARTDTEYEFTAWLDFAMDGTVTVSKTRNGELLPLGAVYERKDIPALVMRLVAWLESGVEETPEASLVRRIGTATKEELQALNPELKAFTEAHPDRRASLGEKYMARRQKLAEQETGA